MTQESGRWGGLWLKNFVANECARDGAPREVGESGTEALGRDTNDAWRSSGEKRKLICCANPQPKRNLRTGHRERDEGMFQVPLLIERQLDVEPLINGLWLISWYSQFLLSSTGVFILLFINKIKKLAEAGSSGLPDCGLSTTYDLESESAKISMTNDQGDGMKRNQRPHVADNERYPNWIYYSETMKNQEITSKPCFYNQIKPRRIRHHKVLTIWKRQIRVRK